MFIGIFLFHQSFLYFYLYHFFYVFFLLCYFLFYLPVLYYDFRFQYGAFVKANILCDLTKLCGYLKFFFIIFYTEASTSHLLITSFFNTPLFYHGFPLNLIYARILLYMTYFLLYE